MHFTVFINVDVPHTEEEPEIDAEVVEEMKRLRSELSATEHNIMAGINLELLHAKTNVFGRNVVDAVGDFMEPYYDQTEDREYLEFYDETEQLQKEYEQDATDAFITPDGRLVTQRDKSIRYRFVIHDGVVYEKLSKPHYHEKRTGKAKKLRAVPNCPYKHLYKTLADFAEYEYGYSWDEEEEGYGYYYNPNGVYDWYSIGGRWPNMFLVRDNCTEYCRGEIRDEYDSKPVSEGYRWVSGARKRDIEWDVMHNFHREEAIRAYHELAKCFAEHRIPKEGFYQLTDDGINSWSQKAYIRGETLDEYLNRMGYGKTSGHYPVPYGYISEGNYYTDCDEEEIARYIESIPDDDVLVCIDCHE